MTGRVKGLVSRVPEVMLTLLRDKTCSFPIRRPHCVLRLSLPLAMVTGGALSDYCPLTPFDASVTPEKTQGR